MHEIGKKSRPRRTMAYFCKPVFPMQRRPTGAQSRCDAVAPALAAALCGAAEPFHGRLPVTKKTQAQPAIVRVVLDKRHPAVDRASANNAGNVCPIQVQGDRMFARVHRRHQFKFDRGRDDLQAHAKRARLVDQTGDHTDQTVQERFVDHAGVCDHADIRALIPDGNAHEIRFPVCSCASEIIAE